MWRKTFARYSEPQTPLTVIAERCVHAKLMQASCQACVDVCPLDAWVVDDDGMGIDTALCDRCGLCATACPQGAIVSQKVRSALGAQVRNTASIACETAGIGNKPWVIPCLHALGLQELLHLYLGGTRDLNVASGDCASCIRSKALQLRDRVERLNDMLASRNLATISLRVIPASRWKQESENTKPELDGPALSRRNFFRRAAASSMTLGMDIAGLQEEKTFVPLAKQLPWTKRDAIFPCVPHIDPMKCKGCDACALLCPHGAISLHTSDDTSQYRFDAASCTGCAICTDVCNQEAVSVGHWTPQIQSTLDLTSHRCTRCGAPFHLPIALKSQADLCFVCTERNHVRDLYQVIKN